MFPLTNWTISNATLLQVATDIAPFWITVTVASSFLNFLLIAVTLRSNNLRSTCNSLIAVQAFFDAFCTWGNLIFAIFAYKSFFIPVSTCFFVQFPFFCAMNLSTVMILIIGIDRYVCIRHVHWYMHKSSLLYFGSLTTVSVLYTFLAMAANYATATEDPVLCFVSQGMTGRGKDAWAFSQAVINVTVIVIYSKLKQVLQSKKFPNDSGTRKIFRSLYTIVVCYLCGWVATIVLLIALRLLTNDVNLTAAVELAISVFAAINLIIPFFVYVTQSSVYKQEICRLFGIELKKVTPSTCSQLSGNTGQQQL